MIDRTTLRELLTEALEEYEVYNDDLVVEIINRLEDYVEIFDDEDVPEVDID